MKNKLTDRFLANLKAPSAGRLEVFDTLLPGFGIRIGIRGRITYFVMYRVNSKQRRHTIGRYPGMTLGDARSAAATALALAASDVDPQLESMRQSKSQFATLAEEFLERYAQIHQKPTTYRETERYTHSFLIPAWGHLPAKDITRNHIRVLLDEVMDSGKPTTANRVFATLSKLFNWCVQNGYLETAASEGMRAPAKEVSRDRVLTLDEIRAIWGAADEMAYPFGLWVQMMFATGGQRSSDVARMQCSEIRGAWWEIGSPTKSDAPHRVPLSQLALEIIDRIPRFEGPYLFSTQAGEIPISGLSKAKKQLDLKSNVKNWRYHDIRRTVATMFGEQLGLHPYVIERIQNRKSGTIEGVMRVYNRATYDDETRLAMTSWATFIRSTVQPNSNVVALHE